jgi:hypothetical protein
MNGQDVETPVCRRHRAISLLLANDPAVLEFLLDSRRSRLNASSGTLKREAALLSSDEELLVRIALDIWNGSGRTRLADTWRFLPDYRFESFLLALEFLGATAYSGCHCHVCKDKHPRDVVHSVTDF